MQLLSIVTLRKEQEAESIVVGFFGMSAGAGRAKLYPETKKTPCIFDPLQVICNAYGSGKTP